MAKVTYTNLPPNFLASEVGLVLKTKEFSNSGISADTEGKKIIAAGSVYPSNDSNAVGIVFQPIDVTNGDTPGSVIVAGRVYENRLTVTLDSNAKTALKANGLFFETAPDTTR